MEQLKRRKVLWQRTKLHIEYRKTNLVMFLVIGIHLLKMHLDMEKIQRGAGTSNESEMTKLAEQLQTLISDERWHHVSKRMEALEKFDKRVVEAFYDCMPNTIETNSALDVITLPSLEDGYANAALVGMSGCGKTTLLRKMMGTTKKGFQQLQLIVLQLVICRSLELR